MPRFTGGPANINDLLSSTLEKYRDDLVNQWVNGFPIFSNIFKRGNVIMEEGESVVVPLDYQDNDTVAWVGANDSVSTNINQTLTHTVFKWAEIAGSYGISDSDLAKNSGNKTRLINLLEHRLKNLLTTKKDQLEVAAAAASTPNANQIWSLLDIVDASDPTLGNLGDIDRDTFDWWQATEIASGSMAVQGLEDIRNGYYTVSKSGTDFVDNHLTTLTLFLAYNARLTPMERLTAGGKGDAEFQSLAFANKPVYYSENLPTGFWLGLNTKYLKFYINKAMNFKNYGFVRSEGGRKQSAVISTMCQFVCTRPASQFKLTGMTA